MTHRPHPDAAYDDASDAVVYAECERCVEHAEQIVTLDEDHLRRLLARVYNVERQGTERYRNGIEARAGRQVWRVALAMQRVHGTPLRTLLLGEAEVAVP